jgi:hypothetical protein
MTPNRKPLKKPRVRAFTYQGGYCYYCNQPMWNQSPEELTFRYRLSSKQALLLRCTGEHLHAHSEGGSNHSGNIVAACHFCNQTRHKRKKPLPPETYRGHVRKQLSKGKWHGLSLHSV